MSAAPGAALRVVRLNIQGRDYREIEARPVAAHTAEFVRRESGRARAAQKRWLKRGGSGSDPLSPWWKWNAIQMCEELRKQFEADKPGALFAAIHQCAKHGLVPPPWASNAFRRGYKIVSDLGSNSWDQVFGQPYGRHARLSAMRRKQSLRFRVRHNVKTLIDRGFPIDNAFRIFGKEVGISARSAARLYYEVERAVGAPDRRRRTSAQPLNCQKVAQT